MYKLSALFPPEVKSAVKGPEEKPKEFSQKELDEEIRNIEISWIKKLKNDQEAQNLLEKLERNHSEVLSVQHQKVMYLKVILSLNDWLINYKSTPAMI